MTESIAEATRSTGVMKGVKGIDHNQARVNTSTRPTELERAARVVVSDLYAETIKELINSGALPSGLFNYALGKVISRMYQLDTVKSSGVWVGKDKLMQGVSGAIFSDFPSLKQETAGGNKNG